MKMTKHISAQDFEALKSLTNDFVEEHGKDSTAIASAILALLCSRNKQDAKAWLDKWAKLISNLESRKDGQDGICLYCKAETSVDDSSSEPVVRHYGAACPDFKKRGGTRRVDDMGWKNWETKESTREEMLELDLPKDTAPQKQSSIHELLEME